MAAEKRTATDRLSASGWSEALVRAPWAFDFFQALRRIEAAHPELPRLGEAKRPRDEPVRLGQEPSLTFAPATLSVAQPLPEGRMRVLVRFLGLFGPNGALPRHLTELARERQRAYGDPTLARFADIFHRRLLLQFYRAWRQAQPVASLDRPHEGRFHTYVGALFGQGAPEWIGRDAVPDMAKRFFAGQLVRAARNADGLADIISADLGVAAEVRSFVPAWLRLPVAARSRLGRPGPAATLGAGATLGARVPDVQHHFGLRIGPVGLARFRDFLPVGRSAMRLRDWVRNYTADEWQWSAVVLLRRTEVPSARLDGSAALGWTSWLGVRPTASDADDFVLHPEVIGACPATASRA